ncbi:hypothetical protein BZA05DRAFT_472174 [Tricharina praecox]|uniref:uncharacterized protein n=1 Tax=Tricharina praecox TaxID=43433 RepID=UPI0022206164|nr:uncharacterized protein BZA05DRAFT_472174 [Tricharina praecox]KAI5855279.1 hypothetical protein BZA05DRAFT_472174 [Tricharina praecox]
MRRHDRHETERTDERNTVAIEVMEEGGGGRGNAWDGQTADLFFQLPFLYCHSHRGFGSIIFVGFYTLLVVFGDLYYLCITTILVSYLQYLHGHGYPIQHMYVTTVGGVVGGDTLYLQRCHAPSPGDGEMPGANG